MMIEKISTTENAPLSIVEKMVNTGKELNKGKVALYITNGLQILVKPELATEEYRQNFIKKYKIKISI